MLHRNMVTTMTKLLILFCRSEYRATAADCGNPAAVRKSYAAEKALMASHIMAQYQYVALCRSPLRHDCGNCGKTPEIAKSAAVRGLPFRGNPYDCGSDFRSAGE